MEFLLDYKVKNKLKAPELENIVLGGEIGIRFDRFIHERISGSFARNEIMREAEDCFRDQYDDEFSYGLWRGEFWGKMMLSAARTCRMKNDPGLKEFLQGSAKRLISFQREDGYLSSYRNSGNILPAPLETVMQETDDYLNYNWNVWSQKYTIWGLIECALLCDDQEILDAADKLAEHLLQNVENSGMGIRYCSLFAGMPACSVMKPLLILYRLTGKEKYLNFCKEIADLWRRDDIRPGLLVKPFAGTAPAHWFDGEEYSEIWRAKAYEMMSCYDGLCELYRVTGDESLLGAVKAIYEVLIKHEANILGSVGYNEWFNVAAAYADASTETCDVIHWMRLCYELFCLTGDAKYMESFENAFINAFLAGVCEDGCWGAFFIRACGRHLTDFPHTETKYHHCCVDNIPRGFCNAAEAICMQSDNDYYLNSYIPARITFGDMSIKLGGGYLDNGTVAVTVRNFPEGAKLYLRVPQWSKTTTAVMDGKTIKLKAGEYNPVEISGDAVIRLSFDMTPRICDFKGTYRVLDDSDYHIYRWCDEPAGACNRDCMVKHPMSTLRRGAVLYARSKRFYAKEEEMFSGKTVFGQNYTCTAEPYAHYGLLAGCKFTFEKGNDKFTYLMCDFASAANKKLDDARYFTVFI